VTDYIAQRYKGYAVVWNSVNACTTQPVYQEMKRLGYLFLPARSVYILEQFEGFPRSIRREIRWDTKLLQTSGFHCADSIPDHEVVALYNQLYVDKYSQNNPKYNQELVKLTRERGLIRYIALKTAEGNAAGVLGYFARQGIMTTPILGYDFSYDKAVGLYRQLSIKLFWEAKEKGYVLHSSSGVGRFKMARGNRRYWEYRVVAVENTSVFTQTAFRLLRLIITKIGVPMMDKLKL
jgi:hypothetical protein